jgi:transposase
MEVKTPLFLYLDKHRPKIEKMLSERVAKKAIAEKYKVSSQTFSLYMVSRNLRKKIILDILNENSNYIYSLADKGISRAEIAKEVGVSVASVDRFLREELTDKIEEKYKENTKIFDSNEAEIESAIKNHVPLLVIAKEFGKSYPLLSRWLLRKNKSGWKESAVYIILENDRDEILNHLAKGGTSPQIAKKYRTNRKTVESWLRKIGKRIEELR